MGLFPAKSLELRNNNSDALLVLPGIGYGPSGRKAMQHFFHTAEVDLFVPDYIQKSGLDDSVKFLQDYYARNELFKYQRLHVFCFIAGAYVLRRWLRSSNLKPSSVILDRSPYQERAPAIVTTQIPFIARLLLGDFVFQLAKESYPDLSKDLHGAIKPGLVIEQKRTLILKVFAGQCRRMGPIHWQPESMQTSIQDHIYVPYHHDSIYANFHRLSPQIMEFIRSGSFGKARRNPPLLHV